MYPLWQTSDTMDDVWDTLAQLETRLGEPSVFSRYDGFPRQLERELGGYGNAVIPQVAEYLGRCILEMEGR